MRLNVNTSFLKFYNIIINVSISTLIIFIVLFIYLQLQGYKSRVRESLESNMDQQVASLEHFLSFTSRYVKRMDLYTRKYFSAKDKTNYTSQFQYKHYNDNVGKDYFTFSSNFGELTAAGEYSKINFKDEVNMVLGLFTTQYLSHQTHPQFTWSYYISKNMINALVPYLPIQQLLTMTTSHNLHELMQKLIFKKSYWTMSLPENNPERKSFWTETYRDTGGKGLMVTHGVPIYNKHEFLGVAATDILLNDLAKFLNKFSFTSSVNFIVNKHNQVLSSTQADKASVRHPTVNLEDIVPPNFNFQQFNKMTWDKDKSIYEQNGLYIIIKDIKIAPWKYVFYIKSSELTTQFISKNLFHLILITLLLIVLVIANLAIRFFAKKQTSLHKELEILVKKRTRNLDQEIENRKLVEDDLITAKEDAEKANSAKGLFLANMSHEIRTPMNAIMGFSSLMIEEKDPRKINQYVDIINKSGQHLIQLIDDILELSKIEEGHITLKKNSINLKDLVDEFKDIFSHKLNASEKIKLVVDYDPELFNYYVGDGQKLRQIITNLLDNAVKFTQDKGGHILLQALKLTNRDNEAKEMVLIKVEDTGIGISPEYQKQMFCPFSQADESSTRPYGGTGLGLSIVKKIVDALEGTIEFTSTEGEGTTFLVTLPLLKDRRHISRNKVVTQNDGQEQTQTQKLPIDETVDILVAEDDPINQTLIGEILKKIGRTFEVVGNGKEVLEKLEHTTYKIILMDLQMPELDGLAATIQIRSKGIKIPIIALTAHALVEYKVKAKKAGMNDYLTKPIDRDDLRVTLAKYL
ncbi:MAG: response regulator [Bacteriovoracaceae bacterium]|nr:response regulator [Bacteriovoracaceae bacterium]